MSESYEAHRGVHVIKHLHNFFKKNKKGVNGNYDTKLEQLQPRTQGLTYGKDPGWGWSRDFTKIDWIRGEGRVSNCMLPQKMLHFNYKE